MLLEAVRLAISMSSLRAMVAASLTRALRSAPLQGQTRHRMVVGGATKGGREGGKQREGVARSEVGTYKGMGK